MTKNLHIIILVLLSLIISNYTIGQSTLTVTGGGKINITSGTSVQSQNLDIGSGSQLVNRGNLTVNEVLTNNAGTPGLVIKADENGYGSLMHSTAAVPATVEQYLTSDRWHLVSPPVSNETIETYLDIYLKKWHESDGTWEYLTQPLSIELSSTKGYSAWASNGLTGTATVSFEGNLIAGDMAAQALSYTSGSPQPGWNLVGNPYPSTVEWNTSWNLTNIGGWAVIYENGTFRGWNPYLPVGEQSYNGKTNGLIAPTQGFWIRALSSNPYLIFKQDARSHGDVPFYKDDSESSSIQSIHLIASANGYTDETSILFIEDGTTGFDGLYELEKHFNVEEAPTFYSIPETGTPTAVNILPDNWITETNSPIIPLGFEILPGTLCTISSTGLETFNPDLTIYLEDLEENVLHDLSYGDYSFTSIDQFSTDRFLLHFGSPNQVEENSISDYQIYSHNEFVYVKIPASISGNATIYDMMGKEVISFRLENELTKQAVFQTGYYVVSIITNDQYLTQKVYIKI